MSNTNRMLRYYWQNKGDLERWIGFKTATDIPPQVRKAWSDFVVASKILDDVIAALKVEDE